jgi:hypothetical protein
MPMPNSTCPTCGQPMQGDDCPRCRAATAFAKPEDAEQAKVTPPYASDHGGFREGPPPISPDSMPPEFDEMSPIMGRLLFWILGGVLFWGIFGFILLEIIGR